MYNWARTVKLGNTNQIVEPKNEEELQKIILSRRPYQKVKVVGSAMSCLGIAGVDNLANNLDDGDILLDLSNFSGLIHLGENEATFGAATILQDVYEVLKAHGKQLTSCAGVLLTQTLAGAIATGTHGQGLKGGGGLYDSVKNIRAILSDNSIIKVSRTDTDSSLFDAFRLHLGCLGILTEITLDIEPIQIFKLTKEVTDFQDFYENFIKWNKSSPQCKAWWFPGTDHVQVWRSYEANAEELEYYKNNGSNLIQAPSSNTTVCDKSSNDEFIHTLDNLIEKMDHDTSVSPHIPDELKQELNEAHSFMEHNARFQTVNRFRSVENFIGNMSQLWCKGIPAPQINCEIAIPLTQLHKALNYLHKFKEESKRKLLHYPFIFRATGPSTAWLSPSYGQNVCYIGFLVYLSEDNYSVATECFEVLKEIELLLSDHVNGIPHYGKFMTVENYDFPKLLPKWNDFLKLRKKLDPQGTFMNKFLSELLLQGKENRPVE